jgi:prolipoprotein diacylglyceryltransferase
MVLDVTLDPIVAQWGSVVLTWNSVCVTLALVIGTLGALRRAARAQIVPAVAGWIACWTLLGGWAGSRALHVVAHWAYYMASPHDLLLVGDGYGSLVGALLGGALVLVVAARRTAVPLVALLDAVVPPVSIGAALHALGDLLTGAG